MDGRDWIAGSPDSLEAVLITYSALNSREGHIFNAEGSLTLAPTTLVLAENLNEIVRE